jgi:LacI family transcriptional regulator
VGIKRTAPARIGIKDVAEAAGVSVATVSRVLNGVDTVGPELRARVVRVSQQLGYRPNPHARALHTGRSHAVGIAATYLGGFFGTLFDGLEARFAHAGYRLLVASGDGGRASEKATVTDLLNRRVDGLVSALESVSNSDLLDLAQRGTPLVLVGRVVPGLESRCLAFDQREGGAMAARHLLEMGHRRVGHIAGPPQNLHARERREGFVAAMAAAGVPVGDEHIATGDFQERGGRDTMLELLERPGLTAVFAANDQMAIGALGALWEKGLNCPDDVSLIGFDDQHAAPYLAPPLTTIRQPLEELGRLAADRLLLEIHGNRVAGRPELPTLALVKRASVRRREVSLARKS